MSPRIEFEHDGSRLVVPVLILAPSPSTSFEGFQGNALLDTGATATGITKKVAQALNLMPRGKLPMGYAQGEGQAERFLFRVGLHGAGHSPTLPYVFDDVIGFELANSFRFDALIGMDILGKCDFEMLRSKKCSLSFG